MCFCSRWFHIKKQVKPFGLSGWNSGIIMIMEAVRTYCRWREDNIWIRESSIDHDNKAQAMIALVQLLFAFVTSSADTASVAWFRFCALSEPLWSSRSSGKYRWWPRSKEIFASGSRPLARRLTTTRLCLASRSKDCWSADRGSLLVSNSNCNTERRRHLAL